MVFPRAFSSYTPKYCIPDHVYGVILITGDRETAVVCGRETGKWSFPKGHGNRDERPLEAALRELKEETGISMSRYITPDNEIHFKSSTYFIYCITAKLDLQSEDTQEVIDTMWSPIQRLPFLFGNRDLNAFCHMSIDNILDRIEFKRSQQIHPVDILVSV